MDIFSVAPQTTPTENPKKAFITLNGTAVEFTMLRDAIDKALTGGPQVFETQSSAGMALRIIVDRLGAPLQGN
jgi:hypothetical protein